MSNSLLTKKIINFADYKRNNKNASWPHKTQQNYC